MRGGVLVLKDFGAVAGPEKVRTTCTFPPGSGDELTLWSVLAASAGPATSRSSIASHGIHPRPGRPGSPLARSMESAGLIIMNVTPGESLFFAKCDAGVALHPTARTIRNQFHQIDFIGGHLGDVAIVLAHVFADANLVDHALRVLDQCLHAALAPDGPDHLQAVERERFQRLARADRKSVVKGRGGGGG